MCAKQLKEHVKQVKKLVQVHTVVLCVGPFLCRFSIDRTVFSRVDCIKQIGRMVHGPIIFRRGFRTLVL